MKTAMEQTAVQHQREVAALQSELDAMQQSSSAEREACLKLKQKVNGLEERLEQAGAYSAEVGNQAAMAAAATEAELAKCQQGLACVKVWPHCKCHGDCTPSPS